MIIHATNKPTNIEYGILLSLSSLWAYIHENPNRIYKIGQTIPNTHDGGLNETAAPAVFPILQIEDVINPVTIGMNNSTHS